MTSHWRLRSYVASSLNSHVNSYKSPSNCWCGLITVKRTHTLSLWYHDSRKLLSNLSEASQQRFPRSSQCLEFLPLQSNLDTLRESTLTLGWFNPTHTKRLPFYYTKPNLKSSLLRLAVYHGWKVIFSVPSWKNNNAPWVDDIGYVTSRPFPAYLQFFYWPVLKMIKYLRGFDWIAV